MLKQPKILAGIGLGLIVVVLSVVAYKMYFKRGSVDETQWIFHPDEVLSMRWRVGDQEWVFSRQSGHWDPDIDARLVQGKLVALSRYSENEGSGSGGDIQVDLGFRNGDQWSAQVMGSQVVWVTGPFEGRAVPIEGKTERVFGEGLKAFDGRRVEWCRSRPQAIEIKIGAEGFKLTIDKAGGWMVTFDGKSKPVDPTRVEQWLSRLCSFEVEHHIHPAPRSKWLSSPNMSVHVEFQDQSRLSMERFGEAWVTSDEKGFYSQAFDQMVEEARKFIAVN